MIKGKIISKLLVTAMCTSLVPATMAFAGEKDNGQEKVTNVIRTTGAAVSFDEGNKTSVQANNAVANSITDTDASEFTFDQRTGTITKYIGNDAIVFIPSTINGVTVKSIGDNAFLRCSNITNVYIPDTVTSIGNFAFYYCTNLSPRIAIPDSVTSIGNSAFDHCSSLTDIILPDSVTSIGTSAFGYCNNLKTVPLPKNLKSIGDNAFWYCDSLATVTIPDGVTSIGQYAYEGCSNLENVTIPDSVTSIGKNAFLKSNKALFYVKSLTEKQILINNGIDEKRIIVIGEATPESDFEFDENTGTITKYIGTDTEVIIPSTINGINVKALGKEAFYECSGLKSVTIPEGITSIGESTFDRCMNLASVTIPDSVTSIGKYAFSECFGLTRMLLPEGITSIGEGAFDRCENLVSVAIPDSVTSIGKYAFAACFDLRDIVIPSKVTEIEEGTFSGCSKLTSIMIQHSVTNIGNYAFDECDNALFYVKDRDVITYLVNYGIDRSRIILVQ